MEKEVVFSQEVKVDFEFKAGKIIIRLAYAGEGAGAAVELNASADYFLDKLAAAIPGQIDDQVIALIKLGLKNA